MNQFDAQRYNNIIGQMRKLLKMGKDQGVLFGDADDNDVAGITYNHSSNYMAFNTAAAERMRIDSSVMYKLEHHL